MIRFLVNRPVAVMVSFFALLLLGATAYTYLPTSLLPDSDIPEITVKLKGEHLSSEEVEQQLTTPMRNALSQLQGLEHIESRSSEGSSTISLRFETGSDISLRFIEINEKVDMAMNYLPRQAERPVVTKIGVDDIPVFHLNVAPRDQSLGNDKLVEVSSFVREVIRSRIEQLSEVAMVDVTGTMQPIVSIEPKQGYLESLGLDKKILLQTFRESKINLGNILVRDGQYRYFLKFTADVESISTIRSTIINVDGRLLKLGDLATVSFANGYETGAFYNNGQRAINLAVIKQSSARIESLNKNFNSLLERMRNDYPDLTFNLSRDQTELLNYAIGNLRQDLWIGGVLAALLMLVFIRRIRPGVLIGITIPVSLIISQLGFYIFDISINIISLGGLILGLGMIIDNSIVVIDNIQRFRDDGFNVSESAIRGTNEVIRPLITSVLSNCAVFVPLIFLSGLAGAIFFDQAISVTIGIIASLIVSILLLPPLYTMVYSRNRRKEFEFKSRVNVTKKYEYGLRMVFDHPVLVCVIICTILIAGYGVYTVLDKDRLPKITRDDLEISIDWNESIGITENWSRLKKLLHVVENMVATSNIWVGKQQYLMGQEKEQSQSQSSIYIRAATGVDPDSLLTRIQTQAQQIFPTAILESKPAENAFDKVFSNRQAQLRVLVSTKDSRDMPSIETTISLLDTLTRILPHARLNSPSLQRKILLRTDPLQAARNGVTIGELTNSIESSFKPTLVDHYQAAHELVPILLSSQNHQNVDELLTRTFIKKQNGLEIPLSAFVNTEYTSTYGQITAGASGRYYPIDIETERPEEDITFIRNLTESDFPSLEAIYSGAYFDNQQLVSQMFVVLLVSILLLYFILAAQFESLLQPLFILAELPIAMSGALLAIYVAGHSINLMSMIGMVVMCGLIINDSILKLDSINRLRRQGIPLIEAIYQGGHKRLKPIVMITLTSIGALLPTLFMDDLGSEIQQPLALSLIGGMTMGLFVSLFFVPLLYWMFYRRRIKIKKH